MFLYINILLDFRKPMIKIAVNIRRKTLDAALRAKKC
jgi:hypothetical protein